MLLQCAQVDLWTDGQRVAFADPMQKNMNSALGGVGFDIAKRLEMSAPVHDRIAEILAATVHSS